MSTRPSEVPTAARLCATPVRIVISIANRMLNAQCAAICNNDINMIGITAGHPGGWIVPIEQWCGRIESDDFGQFARAKMLTGYNCTKHTFQLANGLHIRNLRIKKYKSPTETGNMSAQTVSNQMCRFDIQSGVDRKEINELRHVLAHTLDTANGIDVIECICTGTPIDNEQIDIVLTVDQEGCDAKNFFYFIFFAHENFKTGIARYIPLTNISVNQPPARQPCVTKRVGRFGLKSELCSASKSSAFNNCGWSMLRSVNNSKRTPNLGEKWGTGCDRATNVFTSCNSPSESGTKHHSPSFSASVGGFSKTISSLSTVKAVISMLLHYIIKEWLFGCLAAFTYLWLQRGANKLPKTAAYLLLYV